MFIFLTLFCHFVSLLGLRLNNAASGGFSGFSFPNAPRAIKDHRNIKKPNGFPLNPGTRPFIQFKGNTAHSSGGGDENRA